MTVEIGINGISTTDFIAIAADCESVSLSKEAVTKVAEADEALRQLIGAGEVIYGVTTGYGVASGSRILPSELANFQLDTIRSHACGTGEPLDFSVARGVWIAKLAAVATGRTGASLGLANRLCGLLNTSLAPVIPQIGSLGASGDLVPSAHAGLCLLTEGEVMNRSGEIFPGAILKSKFGLTPLELGPRDGLSMVNGTAVTLSLATCALAEANSLIKRADLQVAAGLEVLNGHVEAFSDPVVSSIGHSGARECADAVIGGLVGWSRVDDGGQGIHDPYSLRCVPQVHGSFYWAVEGLARVATEQLSGCSDNPLVIKDPTWRVVSGGNFHAAILAVATDSVLLSLSQVSAIVRQRCARMLSGGSGLPVGLAADGTPSNGLVQLLATVTALHLQISSQGLASMHPFPLDEVEDHVSNATLAARRLVESLDLLKKELAIEGILIAEAALHTGSQPQGLALSKIVSEAQTILSRERSVPISRRIESWITVIEAYRRMA